MKTGLVVFGCLLRVTVFMAYAVIILLLATGWFTR